MVRFRFKKGLAFYEKSVRWELIRRKATGKLVFESEDGEQVSLKDGEVFSRLSDHMWEIDEKSLGLVGQDFALASPKDLRALSEKAQATVIRKLAYIRGAQQILDDGNKLLNSSPAKLSERIVSVAAALGDAHPPSASTVWRWWKRFATTKSTIKLVDLRRGGVCRKTDEQVRVLEDAVCEVYLNSQKRPIKEVVDKVHAKIDKINTAREAEAKITKPSTATIYRWMRTLYYEIVQTARHGKRVTERELRQSMQGVQVSRVLERIELDHTPIDINLICSETKMVLGRPWLTLAIDRKSRMIAGFYVSFHAPSASSVLYCLRMAIKPKDELLANYKDLRNDWPVYGFFETLAVDNGMEEHAGALEAVCMVFCIELLYCEPGKPMHKGGIERFIGTSARALVHQLPGTLFSNPEERGDYPSEKLAALDLKTFTRLLVKWIVDIYHVTPHRGLDGKTPLQVWQEEATKRTIELPAYPAELDTMVGIEATRTAFHYGIEYDSLRYNSEQINAMRRRTGDNLRLKIRAYDHDVGYIDVFDPHGDEFIRVSAVDVDYARGLSRIAHMRVMASARKRFGDDPTAAQRREVKQEIEDIVEAAIRSKKTRVRKIAAVMRQHDSEKVLGTRPGDAFDAALEPIDPNQSSEIPLHAVDPGSKRPIYGVSDRRLGE